ncbi:MAG: hypothetical protein ACK546_00560, partial [bacterium]
MAFSPLSIGIELQPPGVDQRWVRIWFATVECRACLSPTQGNGAAAAKCSAVFLAIQRVDDHPAGVRNGCQLR